MSLQALINRPVVILHRSESGQIDEAGDEVLTEEAVETVAEIQPRDTGEPREHADVAVSDWVGFFLTADTAYLNAATIVWVPDLGEFEVVGAAETWRNPRTQAETFVQVNLNRVAGPEDATGS